MLPYNIPSVMMSLLQQHHCTLLTLRAPSNHCRLDHVTWYHGIHQWGEEGKVILSRSETPSCREGWSIKTNSMFLMDFPLVALFWVGGGNGIKSEPILVTSLGF